MAEELYYQADGGGEITAIPLDQIPSFVTTDTTRYTPITNLNTTINYSPNGFGTPYTDGWTTIDYTTYDPNAWTTTATPVKTYGWPDNNFTGRFTYPSESTPVDTHELDEFIDSLKVIEGEDDV